MTSSFRKPITRWLIGALLSIAAFSAFADPADTGYRLVFADEFNGTTLNTNKWSAASPGWTMPNAASTASANQVSLGGGVLTLNATRTASGFTSGSVSTYNKYNFDGGYVEARIKLPTTVGSWPAFWGLYTGWPPEADIMEYPLTTNGGSSGFPATDYNTNFHYTNTSGAAAAGAGRVNPANINNLNTDYHTFAMDWVSDTSVKFYFDGAQVSSFTNSAVAQMASMYMILDYAVGGWPGTPDTTQWPVGFSDQTKVDWVRVWQKNPSGDTATTWNINGGGSFATAGNWTSAGSPNFGNQTAVFGRVGSAPAATISMPSFRVIGGIIFNGGADGTTAYMIGSSATLVQLAGQPLGASTSAAVVQASSSSTANQTINSKVELWSNTRFQNDMTGGQTLNFNSEVSGNGALTIEGVGVTVLNAASTYTGGTTIGSAQGPAVLRATADAALGTGGVVIGAAGNASTARLELAGGHILANNIDFRGRNNNSVGIESQSGNNTLAGTLTANVGGSVYQIQSDAGTLTLSGAASNATAAGVALQAATGARTFTLQGAGDGVVGGIIQNGGGTVAIAKAGSGMWTLSGANTYTGSNTVTAGTLRLTGSLAASSQVSVAGVGIFEAAGAAQTLKSATANAGGTLRIAPPTAGPARQLTIGDGTHTFADPLTSALSIAGGKVDVSNNALVIRFAPGSAGPATAAIRGYIASARNGPAADWQGSGITSDAAAADPNNRAVGYALSSALLGPAGGVFMDQPVDGSSLLIRATLPGDATLDGRVDFNDLVHLAQHYNVSDNTIGWLDGDFDYNGVVDFADLVRLAQNYNASLPAAPIVGAPAAFQADLAAAFTDANVPEPGAVALGALALAGYFAPRRRR